MAKSNSKKPPEVGKTKASVLAKPAPGSSARHVYEYLYNVDVAAMDPEERSHMWNAAALFVTRCQQAGRRKEVGR